MRPEILHYLVTATKELVNTRAFHSRRWAHEHSKERFVYQALPRAVNLYYHSLYFEETTPSSFVLLKRQGGSQLVLQPPMRTPRRG